MYLDTCVWCRPFDAVTSDRILKEAKSVNKLMGKVDNNEIEILGSSVTLFEVSMIRDDKRVSVEKLIARVVTEISQVTDSTVDLATRIMNDCSIGAMDAMHLAIAIGPERRYFLVLTFSVVANGSSLAYAKNAGASLSTLRLCDLATLRYIRGTQGRDDARAQRLETTESIRIRIFLATDDAILYRADCVSTYSITVKNPTEMA